MDILKLLLCVQGSPQLRTVGKWSVYHHGLCFLLCLLTPLRLLSAAFTPAFVLSCHTAAEGTC